MAEQDNHRRLASTLQAQLTESDSGEFEVGEQRERNHRYYAMQPLGNEQRGKSHYISPDVLDSVESKKAIFKETFTTARSVIKFAPVSAAPMENEAKTAYCDMVMKRNQQTRLLRDAWHDAFVAKRMVTMTLWKQETREITISLQGATQDQMMQIMAQQVGQERIVNINPEAIQTMNGAAFGDLIVEVDDSFAEVTLCRPERYYRDPNASYPENALWNTYEEDMSKGELKSLGYDEDIVDRLSKDYRWRSEEEDSSRKAHDRSWTRRRQHNRTPGQDMVSLYRTWTWLDLWNEDPEVAEEVQARNGMRLYEIHWSGNEVLRWSDGTLAVRDVDDQPFDEWTEYKISHAEHGMADADITAHTQKTNSTLKRLIIDNQQMRNTSRFSVLQSSLKNPRDLLDNRIGGIVWTKRHDAVKALEVPELSPLTLGVIGLLDQDGDRRSGMSSLGRGMNMDAVSNQNSENLIDKLTVRGNRRVTSAVRDFAETFLVPLYQRIARLGMDNDRRTYQREIKGKTVTIAPQTWVDTEMNIAVPKALTPEEGLMLAQQLLMVHQVQTADPDMRMIYTVAQKHELFARVYDALGIEDTMGLMVRPDSPQFQQAMQQSQQQQQQQQMIMQERDQFQRGMIMSQDRREWEKLTADITDKMADNLREDEKLEHEVAIDWEEIDIERTQNRAATIGG